MIYIIIWKQIKNNLEKDNIENGYRNKSIYILRCSKEELIISCGIIKEIKEGKIIEHLYSTEEGSSGSPILSLKTYKVIGINLEVMKMQIMVH